MRGQPAELWASLRRTRGGAPHTAREPLMTQVSSTGFANDLSSETPNPSGPVLVALKPLDGGESALAMAQWLASRTDRQLHLLSIVEMLDVNAVAAGALPLPAAYYEHERAEAAARLSEQLAAGPPGGPPSRVDVLEGSASSSITRVGRERSAAFVVVGTGRHAVLGRFLHGERALEVVRGATGMVLVVPPAARPPLTHAMVAIDFSQASVRAARSALALLQPGGRLSLVHVKRAVRLSDESLGWWDGEYERRARQMLAHFADTLPAVEGVTVQSVFLRGDAVDTLLRFVNDEGVDLLVCGRRRHPLMERILVGSVSTALVRRAPCSVLVAPELATDTPMEAIAWLAPPLGEALPGSIAELAVL
jgi:nucleotide-binding universal stress UspA family protein